MVKDNNLSSEDSNTKLIEGTDFYLERGLMILTEDFLARRGYCCENGCRHCPYSKTNLGESKQMGL